MRNPFPRHRAQSLVELLFAVTILILMTGAVVGLFVTVLRVEQKNITRIRMAYDTADLHRALRRYAAVGGVNNTVIDANNISVTFSDNDTSPSVIRRLQFVDGDGDPKTIGDNRIEFIPDMNSPDDTQQVISYVSPIDSTTTPGEYSPIFSRAGTFNQPLLVNFRVGDRRGDIMDRDARSGVAECIDEDTWTGPGFQSILFRGAYGPRNVN